MPTEITPSSIGTEEKKGTETNSQPPIPKVEDGIDYLVAIETLETENKRLTTERENYRGAYLKASSKFKSKDTPDEERDQAEDERFQWIVDERLAASQLVANQQKMAELVKKMARENQELKLASVNRPAAVSTTIPGSSSTVPNQNRDISQETLALMKKRGWSDKMIEKYKENLKKPIGQ